MIWYVAAGSAAGGMLRFLLGTFIQQRSATTFPVGTLLVNITGSLLLGFLIQYAEQTPVITPQMRAMLTTGFCGGTQPSQPSVTKRSSCSRMAITGARPCMSS